VCVCVQYVCVQCALKSIIYFGLESLLCSVHVKLLCGVLRPVPCLPLTRTKKYRKPKLPKMFMLITYVKLNSQTRFKSKFIVVSCHNAQTVNNNNAVCTVSWWHDDRGAGVLYTVSRKNMPSNFFPYLCEILIQSVPVKRIFENWSIFGKDIDISLLACFLTYGVMFKEYVAVK